MAWNSLSRYFRRPLLEGSRSNTPESVQDEISLEIFNDGWGLTTRWVTFDQHTFRTLKGLLFYPQGDGGLRHGLEVFVQFIDFRKGQEFNNQTLGLTDPCRFFFFWSIILSVQTHICQPLSFAVCHFLFQNPSVVNNLNFADWLFTLFCSALHSLKMHESSPQYDNKD